MHLICAYSTLIWSSFHEYDKDGSGLLDLKEFHQMIGVLLGEDKYEKSDVTRLFMEFDNDGSGSVSWEEFHATLRTRSAAWTKLSLAAKVSF